MYVGAFCHLFNKRILYCIVVLKHTLTLTINSIITTYLRIGVAHLRHLHEI